MLFSLDVYELLFRDRPEKIENLAGIIVDRSIAEPG